ncbi:MAG: amidohydrolase [bacterium]
MQDNGKIEIDLLISGGIVLQMNGDKPIIDGGVAIKDDKILSVGKETDLSLKFKAKKILNMSDHIVMPGLINTHTHAAMSLLKGLADDLPLMEWLSKYIFPAEASLMSPDFVYTGTLLTGMSMIRSGTTTLADGYFFEDAAAKAISELGMRGIMAQGILDFPNPQYQNPKEGLKKVLDFIQKWKGSEIIRPALLCHSTYTCSPDTLIRALQLSLDTDVLYMIHLSETKDEVDQIRQRYGTTPVRHLEKLGAMGPHMLAVHCVWLDDEEIQIIAKHGVKVAHCAESNMKLAAGIAPVPGLLKAGVTVGIGTDGCASNNNQDMFQEMDVAAKLHKVALFDPTVMDACTVLEMATIQAAKALGLEDKIGSLEPGKKADVICLDLNQPHLVPLYNIPSQIVYAASGLDVDTVIIDGQILLQNRCFTRCDPQEIINKSKTWGETISKKSPSR